MSCCHSPALHPLLGSRSLSLIVQWEKQGLSQEPLFPCPFRPQGLLPSQHGVNGTPAPPLHLTHFTPRCPWRSRGAWVGGLCSQVLVHAPPTCTLGRVLVRDNRRVKATPPQDGEEARQRFPFLDWGNCSKRSLCWRSTPTGQAQTHSRRNTGKALRPWLDWPSLHSGVSQLHLSPQGTN